MLDIQRVSEQIRVLDQEVVHLQKQCAAIVECPSNLPHESVPVGADRVANVEARWQNTPKTFSFESKPHQGIGGALGISDFERGAKVSGSRFLYHKGLGTRLEQAVYNLILDRHVNEHGYTEVILPYLVSSKAMSGTDQLPRFEEDVFQVVESDLTLIPITEVPLANYYNNGISGTQELPIYFTALSPSFCSKADSADRDTRGLIHLHQFRKVEMVKFSDAEHSYEELGKIINNAGDTLEKLGLPYRVIAPPTGDMGFSAVKTHDLEVRIPAQKAHREISSCSDYEDFQTRRVLIHYRDKIGHIQCVHALNGSGLAAGRTVAAILENYQNEDGIATISEVLRPYMGGLTKVD